MTSPFLAPTIGIRLNSGADGGQSQSHEIMKPLLQAGTAGAPALRSYGGDAECPYRPEGDVVSGDDHLVVAAQACE